MNEVQQTRNQQLWRQLARAGALTEVRAIGQSGGSVLAVSFGAQKRGEALRAALGRRARLRAFREPRLL